MDRHVGCVCVLHHTLSLYSAVMATMTKAEYDAYLTKQAVANRARNQRQNPVVQELQASNPRQKNRKTSDVNGGKDAATDGRNHARFHISIVFRYSDNRRRDIDGAAATILDCLVDAAGRFMDVGSKTKS